MGDKDGDEDGHLGGHLFSDKPLLFLWWGGLEAFFLSVTLCVLHIVPSKHLFTNMHLRDQPCNRREGKAVPGSNMSPIKRTVVYNGRS